MECSKDVFFMLIRGLRLPSLVTEGFAEFSGQYAMGLEKGAALGTGCFVDAAASRSAS